MTCPFCKSKNVSYPTVDVGVGEIQCGPAECMDCGAAQIQIRYSTDINAEHMHVEWITFEQRKLDTSNIPTPYAVLCLVHGKRYLTREQYDDQMRHADDKWRCPIADCGRVAEWDDVNYQAAIDEGRV